MGDEGAAAGTCKQPDSVGEAVCCGEERVGISVGILVELVAVPCVVEHGNGVPLRPSRGKDIKGVRRARLAIVDAPQDRDRHNAVLSMIRGRPRLVDMAPHDLLLAEGGDDAFEREQHHTCRRY